jgi:hypothetical protein
MKCFFTGVTLWFERPLINVTPLPRDFDRLLGTSTSSYTGFERLFMIFPQ